MTPQEIETTLKALTDRVRSLEDELANARGTFEIHDARRCEEISRLRSRLDEEERQRSSEDFSLERKIDGVERTAENAQRAADAAQYRGRSW